MTKGKLKEYYWLQRNLQKLEEKLLVLETKATKTTNSLSNGPRGTNSHNSMSDIIVKIVELKEKINKKIEKAYGLITDIENAIEKLPEREKYLMRARYIECKSWEEICVDMNYNWAQIHRLHSNSLKMII